MNLHDDVTHQALADMMPQVQAMARQAGLILMEYYEAHCDNEEFLDIEIKQDESPVTAADFASHEFLAGALAQFTPDIPVISEENADHPDIPPNGRFWTVDPLDGTKGFIGKTGGFYVKLALMDGFEPVLGVVCQPATGEIYHSVLNGRAYYQSPAGQDTEIRARRSDETRSLTTVFNELHHDPAAYEAAKEILRNKGLQIPEKQDALPRVSTVFNLAVAKGEVDAYLDCGGKPELVSGNGFSWDYAPDLLILKNAGGVMVDIISGEGPDFTAPTERMNAMIGLGDKELGKKYFPKLKSDCV